jgi:hypothetical protein
MRAQFDVYFNFCKLFFDFLPQSLMKGYLTRKIMKKNRFHILFQHITGDVLMQKRH